ncbi:hypothetical protein NEIELOOT_00507 [Neisseria elongata subsp. glycolytica ATCC 29315]|uniref:Uncharacterized protein n=1 Tax=Neisseria elongata subsp. glycolytica ATCC 29315 TaxID=546263 RepID=D4DN82_NEIEG|nr:hypothetical protein NEIELOOT_00507 [Neisseria elongata subsp. glycolytica ATCC 29315]
MLGGENRFGRKGNRCGKALAKPIQTADRNKSGFGQFGRQCFQIRQFVFIKRIKTDLLKPHFASLCLSKRRIIQDAQAV